MRKKNCGNSLNANPNSIRVIKGRDSALSGRRSAVSLPNYENHPHHRRNARTRPRDDGGIYPARPRCHRLRTFEKRNHTVAKTISRAERLRRRGRFCQLFRSIKTVIVIIGLFVAFVCSGFAQTNQSLASTNEVKIQTKKEVVPNWAKKDLVSTNHASFLITILFKHTPIVSIFTPAA